MATSNRLSPDEKRYLESAARFGSHNEFFLKEETVSSSNLHLPRLEKKKSNPLVIMIIWLLFAVFLYFLFGCSLQPRINGEIPFTSFYKVPIQYDKDGHAVLDILDLSRVLNKHGFVVVPMDQWKGINDAKDFYRKALTDILKDMTRVKEIR
jgi:hypothetical protein